MFNCNQLQLKSQLGIDKFLNVKPNLADVI